MAWEGPGLRRLSERQVLDFLIYLRDDQKLAGATVNQGPLVSKTGFEMRNLKHVTVDVAYC